MILEVIVTSVADAVAAEQGGATRLEIISCFEQDGLTPSAELVKDITLTVRIPARAMLRERNDFVVGDAAELDRLCEAARAFARLGVDGLVLGFLRDGEIDIPTMQRILACVPNCTVTFHRAIEALRNPHAAIISLKEMSQVNCILTSGGDGSWAMRAQRLAALQAHCGSERSVLVGGGVTAEAIEVVRAATQIRAFHLGRAVREPQTVEGIVSAERVAEFRARITNCL